LFLLFDWNQVHLESAMWLSIPAWVYFIDIVGWAMNSHLSSPTCQPGMLSYSPRLQRFFIRASLGCHAVSDCICGDLIQRYQIRLVLATAWHDFHSPDCFGVSSTSLISFGEVFGDFLKMKWPVHLSRSAMQPFHDCMAKSGGAMETSFHRRLLDSLFVPAWRLFVARLSHNLLQFIIKSLHVHRWNFLPAWQLLVARWSPFSDDAGLFSLQPLARPFLGAMPA
jgi:hypothetical protein